jgi:dethiobiotin synthetase
VKGFFITATGTDIGKTYVSRLLAKEFLQDMPVSYLKPVQTGGKKDKKGNLLALDFEYVKKDLAITLGEYKLHAPYCFEPTCSPHLAAQMAKKPVVLKQIKDCKSKIAKLPGMSRGCLIVEGAGGVLTPVGKQISMLNVMAAINLPYILVTSPALGTLNHTYLTLCALHSIHAPIAGVVVNNSGNCKKDFIYKDNIQMIKSFCMGVPFLELPYKSLEVKKIKTFCKEMLNHGL